MKKAFVAISVFAILIGLGVSVFAQSVERKKPKIKNSGQA
jgi:hypothetical protein